MRYVYKKSEQPASAGEPQISRLRCAPLGATKFLVSALLSLAMTSLGPVALAQAGRPTHPNTTPDSNQSPIAKKKSKNGPRAIGVVEFLASGKTRLVPIALWMDGRFYDASLYGANPAPLAVQPETVYEATNYGETTGLFTITTARELKGNWVGDGAWSPRRALDEKLAAQAAKAPKPKPVANVDDDRPVLRRPGSSGSTDSSKSAGSETKAGSSGKTSSSSPAENDPDRPTLKKPSSTPSASSSTTDDDASVVRLGQKPPTPPPPSPDSDPNRPVLRRGKPQTAPATSAQASDPEDLQPATVAGKPTGAPASPGVRRSLPAVSDAGAYEPRSLLYSMTPEEHAAKADQMRALALEEIGKFIASRHTPALAKAAAITDYDLRSFDLDYTNTPTLVLTAKLPVPGAKAFRNPEFDYFVTVVAREDVNGQPIKIFSSVSDSNHLDAFPNMEIIDAVDADANGRGDLLFRQYSDTGVSYSLFRVFPYSMEKVFEGGSGV